MIGGYRLNYGKLQQSGANMTTWNKSVTASSIKHGHRPGNNEIVLTKQQAIQLTGPRSYRQLVGKQIKISFNWVNKQGAPVAVDGTLKVAGLSEGASAGTTINYATLQRLLRQHNADTRPNFAVANAKDLATVESTANRINNLRNGQNERILSAITVGSVLKTVNTYVHLASTILAAIAGISLLVSALMIIVTMYMSVSERTKEIGILRALGERKKDIRRLFTSESIFIGLFSAILALGIVAVVALILNHALYGLIKYNIVQITVGNVIFAIVVAVVISFIAALLPARHAAKLNPIDALAAD